MKLQILSDLHIEFAPYKFQRTDADIVIRAIGEDTAAFVEVFGTITRATGLTFSVVAPLERNFTNPA